MKNLKQAWRFFLGTKLNFAQNLSNFVYFLTFWATEIFFWPYNSKPLWKCFHRVWIIKKKRFFFGPIQGFTIFFQNSRLRRELFPNNPTIFKSVRKTLFQREYWEMFEYLVFNALFLIERFTSVEFYSINMKFEQRSHTFEDTFIPFG